MSIKKDDYQNESDQNCRSIFSCWRKFVAYWEGKLVVYLRKIYKPQLSKREFKYSVTYR